MAVTTVYKKFGVYRKFQLEISRTENHTLTNPIKKTNSLSIIKKKFTEDFYMFGCKIKFPLFFISRGTGSVALPARRLRTLIG